jgi:hypothetical protein
MCKTNVLKFLKKDLSVNREVVADLFFVKDKKKGNHKKWQSDRFVSCNSSKDWCGFTNDQELYDNK